MAARICHTWLGKEDEAAAASPSRPTTAAEPAPVELADGEEGEEEKVGLRAPIRGSTPAPMAAAAW